MAAKHFSYDALLAAGFLKQEIHQALRSLLLRKANTARWQPAHNIVYQACLNRRFVRGLLNARHARKPKNPV